MAKKMKASAKVIAILIFIGIIYIILHFSGALTPKPTGLSTVPQIDDVVAAPGTKLIRLGHWTWNSHQAWAYANKGKNTSADSIFAKNGITVQFARIEEIPQQIAALVKFAKDFKSGNTNPGGIHFFTIMGDAGGWVLNTTNKALNGVDSNFKAEIIGFGGFSAGEDKFMGLPEWKQNPQSAKGGLVAGVPADGDWNVMIFWCAQNKVPFNSDSKFYDPNALNFYETKDFLDAANVYIASKPIELIFKADGKDYKGNPIKKGDKGLVMINGSVTWTPGDKNIADKRGGLVSIASTKEYSNQMPQYIVGLKQWNQQNKDLVVKMLASIYEAADKINKSNEGLISGRISPKSSKDLRWKAAKYAHEIFGSETQQYWYDYYNVVKVRDTKGLTVEIGGSSVSNLPRNLKYFGLDGSVNIGEVVYNRFAKLALHYYPKTMESYPKWSSVFNPSYMLQVKRDFPKLAMSDPYLPTFTKQETGGSQIGELTYNIAFDSGKSSFKSIANDTLKEALEQLVIAANARVEIHGHTDSQGNADANYDLSRLRAEAVEKWLESHAGSSFPANRVKVVPHGENDLLEKDFVNGQYIQDAMAKNRRVTLKIFSKKD
ncbi:MAG: OmpA family protein [Spirochaetota bacterium]|nr:OmpA family protein [Spirochaetota bacterium]